MQSNLQIESVVGREQATFTCTQCVSSSMSRTPRLSWSVRLSTWSFVCSLSAELCDQRKAVSIPESAAILRFL